MRLRGRKADAIIGEYANRIVAAAAEHRSQIAIEKIDATSMARFLTQSQFAKLHASLTYKAERVGLPAPIEVPAAYTSQTCAKCGHWCRENRPKRDAQGKSIQDVFRCMSCGYECNADDNASEIIALRALHQLKEGGKFQKFGVFLNWLKKETGRDGQVAISAVL
jgi:IS605 OrfB family transposase